MVEPNVGGAAKILATKASVASFVEVSPAVCVVAAVPLGNAGVPLRLAAVPVVFWLSVGIVPAVVKFNVVNEPVEGVVPPIAPGAGQVMLAGNTVE